MGSFCWSAFLKNKIKLKKNGGRRENLKAHPSLPPVQMTKVENWKGKEALHTAVNNRKGASKNARGLRCYVLHNPKGRGNNDEPASSKEATLKSVHNLWHLETDIDLNISPKTSCHQAFHKMHINSVSLSSHHNLFKHSFLFSFTFVNRNRSRTSFLEFHVQMTADCK